VLRAEYLFDMAATCHCPPPVADRMRLIDWALLVTGIDQARKREGEPCP
jgi:hypothetical protein